MKTLHNTVFIAIMVTGFIGLVKADSFTKFILVACVTLSVFVLYFLLFMKMETKRQKKAAQDEIDKSIKILRSFPDNLNFKISDNISGDYIGELNRDDLFFLIKAFSESGMKSNDFYFLEELLELFEKEKNPPQTLMVFLKRTLEKKEEVELHWESPE